VKARAIRSGIRTGAVFSAFRSFDFDIAVFIAVDSSTYDLLWAREVPATDIEGASRYSLHVNGYLVPVTTGARLGTDVTPRFNASLSA
jgi:hypothetical protein